MFALVDLLFPPRDDEKLLRASTHESFVALATPLWVPQTRPASATLLPFHEPVVRAALHEAKYHGSEKAFTLLAAALAQYLRERGEAPTTLLPIPLGKMRRKERGFNQVEEVAKRALKTLGDPRLTLDTSLLTRARETGTQVSLPRHLREENMRDAFTASRLPDPTLSYLIVDDVLTTGATLQAALDALTAAGATSVTALALAH